MSKNTQDNKFHLPFSMTPAGRGIACISIGRDDNFCVIGENTSRNGERAVSV